MAKLSPAVIEAHELALRDGLTIEEASREIGHDRETFHRWRDRGAAAAPGTLYAEFYRRVCVPRKAFRSPGALKPTLSAGEGRLSKKDLLRLLEEQAEKGNVRAIHLLLEKPWDRAARIAATKDEKPAPKTVFDELQQMRERKA